MENKLAAIHEMEERERIKDAELHEWQNNVTFTFFTKNLRKNNFDESSIYFG